MSLLEKSKQLISSVEPDCWRKNESVQWDSRIHTTITHKSEFPEKVARLFNSPLYSRETVESLLAENRKQVLLEALTGSGLDGYAKELLQFHDEIEESEYTTLDVQELNALTRLGWLDKTGLCAWELTDEGRYVVGIMDELRRMAESTKGEKE